MSVEETQRKSCAPPAIENIPPELLALVQWVVWRYEWRKDKWTKVPYTPYAMHKGKPCKAMPNKPATWRAFDIAYGCYLEMSHFFDGIGFMFLKGGPFVGGDRDHCIADGAIDPDVLELIPPTYAEISPSGEGLKFIARATGTYGRKTSKGELYNWGRFFTITGNVLAGYTAITECQAAVDIFHASLGGSDRATAIREGKPGHGSRAANAAAIPAEEWAEGRRLLREDINNLVARLRNSAKPKRVGNESQLYYVLQDDLGGLQAHYPRANVIRADGSIDQSQVRAIFANGMRMRGFTFPQFVALFYHFYGAECLTKWGTTQAFREEAATLWAIGRTPRVGEYTTPTAQPAPRGRAGSRAELLERTYQVLLTYRAGATATVMLEWVGRDLGVHKDTALRAIKDLVGTRIMTRKHGQHGGLIIEFLPELIIDAAEQHTNGQDNTNESAEGSKTAELIYENEIGVHSAQKPQAMIADEKSAELIYGGGENTRTSVHNRMSVLSDDRGTNPALYIEHINKCPTVYLQGGKINSEKRPRVSIEAAVVEAYDNLPHDRRIAGGELKRWPITKTRVREYVEEHYQEQGWSYGAIDYWIDRIRKKRKAEPFNQARKTKREVLEKKAAALRRAIERFEHKAGESGTPELRHYYTTEAAKLQGRLGLIAWELGQRDIADDARQAANGYTPGEQQEFLELVERERRDTVGLVERLRAAKVRRQNE